MILLKYFINQLFSFSIVWVNNLRITNIGADIVLKGGGKCLQHITLPLHNKQDVTSPCRHSDQPLVHHMRFLVIFSLKINDDYGLDNCRQYTGLFRVRFVQVASYFK